MRNLKKKNMTIFSIVKNVIFLHLLTQPICATQRTYKDHTTINKYKMSCERKILTVSRKVKRKKLLLIFEFSLINVQLSTRFKCVHMPLLGRPEAPLAGSLALTSISPRLFNLMGGGDTSVQGFHLKLRPSC